MIDETDQRLSDWVNSVLADVKVSLASPETQPKGKVVSLYLLDLAPVPSARGGRKIPPLQIALRYLVTAWADKPAVAHRLLGDLAFAAMEEEGFEVASEAPPVEVWQSLGLPPRPSFILKTIVRKARPQPEEPYVRVEPTVDSTPAVPLFGVVTGPGDVPLMGARVEHPTLNLNTRTDSKGRFRFTTVPAAPPSLLKVTAKGKEQSVTADPRSLAGEPLVIHFDELER
ncbi:MAG: carboxypeptidase regulatory-like domain-containing protein [bacterium]|nr:carboxypeptidase regulatory-like domain-containing protein [bacterium]